DFKQFIETIREKLEGDHENDTEQRKAALRRVEMELDEADEMAFNSFPIPDQTTFCKNGVVQVQSNVKGPQLSTCTVKLLAGTALLEDGTKRLQESQRIALETENQGADILMDLRRQRDRSSILGIR
ncbi:hypothetical protein MPER_02502, partial [Moniliophthora perniciosa FA553]